MLHLEHTSTSPRLVQSDCGRHQGAKSSGNDLASRMSSAVDALLSVSRLGGSKPARAGLRKLRSQLRAQIWAKASRVTWNRSGAKLGRSLPHPPRDYRCEKSEPGTVTELLGESRRKKVEWVLRALQGLFAERTKAFVENLGCWRRPAWGLGRAWMGDEAEQKRWRRKQDQAMKTF